MSFARKNHRAISRKTALFLAVTLVVNGCFYALVPETVAQITDGENALDALGSYDDHLAAPNAVYTKSGAQDAPHRLGFSFNSGSNVPAELAFDGTNHRFYVADPDNNRVLVFNLNTDNTFPDRFPDNVLGQPNFYSKTAATTQSGMSNPVAVAVDAANNRMFVGEYGNGRILVFNTTTITNGMNAVNVLGVSDFTTVGGGVTQSSIGCATGVAYDSAANKLYASDYCDSRVLVYDVTTITDGENAINVLGQPNFTTSTGAVTQAKLSGPHQLVVGSSNRLFVADFLNSRIIVYDVATIVDGENAVNVLGQPNFTTATTGTTSAKMYTPSGVAFDSATNRLFATDLNARVLVFDTATIVNGEVAVNVLGQTLFTTQSLNITQSGLLWPSGLAFDSTNSRLLIFDGSDRIIVQNVASITNGQNAFDVIGKYDDGVPPVASFTKGTFSGANANDGPLNRFGLSTATMASGVAMDTVHHRLFVSDTLNHRVLVYNLTAGNVLIDRIADNVLGEADFITASSSSGQNGLNKPAGLAYDGTTDRLFIADQTNNRVVIYNTASITNGMNAANVLGQTGFGPAGTAVTQAGMNSPYGVAYDGTNNRLFVADSGNNRVLVYSVSSITNGQNAANVLGQTTFTVGTVGTTQVKLSAPRSVAYDPTNNRLFIGDMNNSRVIVHSVASITNGQNAANVLGQTNFTTATTGTTQSKLRFPQGVAYDATNSRLLVGDGGNHRVMIFSTTSITDGQNAANVLGQSFFTSGASATTQSGLNSPGQLTYDTTNHRVIVADADNNRVLVFDGNPAAPTNNPTLSNKVTLGRLKAGVSSSLSITFTLQNTLTGTLSITFPAGFTVTGAFISGSCSGGGAIGSFGFTSSTLTASKSGCSGTVTLSGAVVTNPVTPGVYVINWVNDDPGSATVIIVSDDQISVTAAVDPILTFNVGSQAAATACDGTFAANGGSVPLGVLSTANVSSSDASSVAHICVRLTTNASLGATVMVRSANASLKSASTPADAIPSSTTTLIVGTAGYGICAGSTGGDSGKDTTTPIGATPVRSAPFNGASCSSSGHDIGALTTAFQNIWTVSAASQNAFVRVYVKAVISPTTPAHNDYSDTLTFIVTGTY